MSDVFPVISTVSIKEAVSGSIIMLTRHGGQLLALVTDHFINESRSLILLNKPVERGGTSVVFSEKWKNSETALSFGHHARFELGMDELDARGSNWWETPGVIISIGDQLYIRAEPIDSFYGSFQLANIQTGSLFAGYPPNDHWVFLSWRLWLRDPIAERNHMLMEFCVKRQIQ